VFQESEWIEDKINKSDKFWKAKEVLMSAVKWGLWKWFVAERYGGKVEQSSVIINNAIMEVCVFLGKMKEVDILLNIKQWLKL